MVLCLAMMFSTLAYVTGAATDNCIRISDTTGADGYSAAVDDINARIAEEGGVTVVMDVFVESYTNAPEGMFSQIAAFTGGGNAKYNLLSYDFGGKAFKAGQSANWISSDQSDYAAIQTNAFDWQCNRWFELAFRFNGTKAAVYLDGICVISTEFDAVDMDYLIVYPQFCTVSFDNIRICAKDYDVAGESGNVWYTEDFNSVSDAASSSVWYADFAYELAPVAGGSIMGDVDGNGALNLSDITALRRTVSGAEVIVSSGADIDVNGAVNFADVSLLARIIQGYQYVPPAYEPSVTPITPDNSATVDKPADTTVTTVTTVTSTSQTTVTSKDEPEGPDIPASNETFIDGLDGSTIRFNGLTATSYTFMVKEGGIANEDIAISFDALISEIDSTQTFAGLGVWNGDKFVGYDFIDQKFVSDTINYSNAPSSNTTTGLNLKVGEWNHFNFRRINNNTFHVYVNGVKAFEVKDQNYANTFFLFGFKNCTAYVDNYQCYELGVGKGLIDNFSGFTTDGSMLKSNDGGYWLIGSQGFGSIFTDVYEGTATESGIAGTAAAAGETITGGTGLPTSDVSMGSGSGDTSALDDSALKFDTTTNAAYTLLFSSAPQAYSDMALTFDVFVESVSSGADFAGLGVWSGNNDESRSSFVGYDFVSKRFSYDANMFYPTTPTEDTHVKMDLAVGEWNHFCLRRLNNDTFEIYVNGKLCLEVGGQNYVNTYYLFGFKNCVAYVDNYQYYHSGTPCGLVTDFTTGAGTKDGMTIFSDGGYWLVGSQGFSGVVSGTPATDAAVDAVIAKISAIGTVTYNSLSAITAAESAYAALTDAQKAKVTNYSTLTAARSTYNALDAEVVAYKNAVAALPATASNTDACKTAIANCAIAYATLTSPGQVDAVATEKAKYDAFRAEWEKLVAEDTTDVDMGSGSGDKSPVDGSAIKFTASGSSSYTLLFSDQPQSYPDMALTFDVFVESIDSGVDFAGLGVWSGNNDESRSSFTGFDFVDKRFTSDHNTFFPSVPTADSNVKMSLAVGEWNHFCFRRLNNNTFEVYVNGKLCYSVTGFDYANTYYIFAVKNCVAYVDNYQYYHSGIPCGLITDFTAGATTDSSGNTRFADGGYWVVSSLNFSVVKGQPGFDGSALKFNGNTATSYTLVLNEGPISNTDIALTFDVFIESIDDTQNFAGIGLWNGDNTFIGYDFKDQKFTAQKGLGYPYPADNDNGESLALKVGEWNHFVFRRLNNTSIVVFVNGVKGAEITGLSFADTYMICGFKNCIAYVDNYQAYENGVGKGLYTDFSQFTKRSDGALISPDGGYWIVGTQGFDSIYTTVTGGGATGTGIAGTSVVPGSNAVDGSHRINLDSGSTTPTPTPTPTPDTPLQRMLTNIDNSAHITAAKKTACKQVATELYNLGYETAFIAGVIGNVCYEGNTGIFEYYNSNTNYHPNFNSYLQTYYGTTYKAMFSGKFIYNLNLTTVYNIFTDLSNRGWSYNGVRIGTGVGCIQWTFARSYTLIKIYREVTNNGSSITYEQALAAEGLMVSRELSGSYKSVYNTWKNNNAANLNSQDAAYSAAYDVCVKYEVPSDRYNKGVTRGNFAKLVYVDLIA